MHDVIVIGGGIAGVSAALQLVRARRPVALVDAGAPRNRFSDASHGIFGHDGASPLDMLARAQRQLAAYPATTLIEDSAISARAQGEEGFSVELASGAVLTSRLLILAFGVSDGLPDLPGLTERWGHSVLHCGYCHGYEFAGERLGVLEAGPQTLRGARLMADWGPTTFFLNGADQPAADDLAALAARGVAIEPAPVTAVLGEAPGLTGLALADGRVAPLAALFVQQRTRFNSPIAEALGCELDEGPSGMVIRTDSGKRTTVRGVFAAGDIARPSHNASWASADGVTAGIVAHQALVFGLP